MSARTDIPIAELKPIMPALRRMVRFPGRSLPVISTELGVELSVLQAWVKQHGTPTQAQLEDFEDRLSGIERQAMEREPAAPADSARNFVPPPRPASAVAPAVPAVPPAPRTVAPAPAAPARATVPLTAAPKLATVAPAAASDSFRAVAELLCADPKLHEAEACARANVSRSWWCTRKVARFGKGRPTTAQLRLFLGAGTPAPAPLPGPKEVNGLVQPPAAPAPKPANADTRTETIAIPGTPLVLRLTIEIVREGGAR